MNTGSSDSFWDFLWLNGIIFRNQWFLEIYAWSIIWDFFDPTCIASTASDLQTCNLFWGKTSLNVHNLKLFSDFFSWFFEILLMPFRFNCCFVTFYCFNFCFYPSFTQKNYKFWQFLLEAAEAAWGQKSSKCLIWH